jgi:hypothetical protein
MPRTKFKKQKKLKKLNGHKLKDEFMYEGELYVIKEFPGGNSVFGVEKNGHNNVQTSFDRIKPVKKSKNKKNSAGLKIGDYFKVKDGGFTFQVESFPQKNVVFGRNRVLKIGYPSTCQIHTDNVKKVKKSKKKKK